MTTIDNRAPLHSIHVQTAINRLDRGTPMKAIKETLSPYAKQLDVDAIVSHYADSMTATRKADYRGHLCNLYKALKTYEARPAQPVPEITQAQRAEHLQHAEILRTVLVAHGIDDQDFDACMKYLCDGSGLAYMVKIYVDYIYGNPVTIYKPLNRAHDEIILDMRGGFSVTEPVQWVGIDMAHSGSDHTALIVTSQMAATLRADGYTGDLSIVDTIPGFVADEAHIIHPLRSEQELRVRLSKAHQRASKLNKYPRGKCTARMLSLGWEFEL